MAEVRLSGFGKEAQGVQELGRLGGNAQGTDHKNQVNNVNYG